jgi:hypothetical protein
MAPQTPDDARARALLRRYGYLHEDVAAAPEVAAPEAAAGTQADQARAVAEYQRRHRLPPSGVLDAPTREHLSLGRCGWADRDLGGDVESVSLAETLGGAIEITWFLHPIPFAVPAPTAVSLAIATAFAMWQDVAPLRFVRQTQPQSARLMVAFTVVDGQRGVFGVTKVGGPLALDAGELWSLTNPPRFDGTADVLTIALHEIGHAVGVGHVESDPQAVMHGFYPPSGVAIRQAFTQGDHQAIAVRFST